MTKRGIALPDVGARWAEALRRRYLFCAAKRIAADFGVDVRTAKNWLGGQAPLAAYYQIAWRLFGIDFIVETLSPFPNVDRQNLDAEFDACRKHIAALREYALKGLLK